MREVVDGVFELRLGFVNMFVVVTDDGLVLVDTGLPRRLAKIEQALAGVERSLGEVRTVLLTHRHFDHTGNVAQVREKSKATVVAHALDAAVISGAIPPADPPNPIARLISRRLTAEPTRIDQVISGGESEPLPGFTAVHTPGHTQGHVSFLLDRAGGVLFAGDAAGSARGSVNAGQKMATADWDEQMRSVRKLATYDFDHAVFGHSPAVTGGAVEKFREFAASLP